MKLKNCFAGIPVGGKCTGTVRFFGLQASRLERMGVISEEGGEYVFHGFSLESVSTLEHEDLQDDAAQ